MTAKELEKRVIDLEKQLEDKRLTCSPTQSNSTTLAKVTLTAK